MLHLVWPTEYSCETWSESMEQALEGCEKQIAAGQLKKKTRIRSTTKPAFCCPLISPDLDSRPLDLFQ